MLEGLKKEWLYCKKHSSFKVLKHNEFFFHLFIQGIFCKALLSSTTEINGAGREKHFKLLNYCFFLWTSRPIIRYFFPKLCGQLFFHGSEPEDRIPDWIYCKLVHIWWWFHTHHVSTLSLAVTPGSPFLQIYGSSS